MASAFNTEGLHVDPWLERLDRLTANVKPPHLVAVPRHSIYLRGMSRRPRTRLNSAWVDWVHSFAPWSIMVTYTFKRLSPLGFRATENTVMRAVKRILRLVNCDLFGKRRTNKGWTIAHAVVVDHGPSRDNLHAHLLVATINGVPPQRLCALLERAIQRTHLVDRQRDYRAYYSPGGSGYLIDHGTDRMVVSLLAPTFQGE